MCVCVFAQSLCVCEDAPVVRTHKQRRQLCTCAAEATVEATACASHINSGVRNSCQSADREREWGRERATHDDIDCLSLLSLQSNSVMGGGGRGNPRRRRRCTLHLTQTSLSPSPPPSLLLLLLLSTPLRRRSRFAVQVRRFSPFFPFCFFLFISFCLPAIENFSNKAKGSGSGCVAKRTRGKQFNCSQTRRK